MKKLDLHTVIQRFIGTHGDRYDYSMVDFTGVDKKVLIQCKLHGPFKQTPKRHQAGDGCPQCAASNRPIMSTDMFINKAESVHGGKFDYSHVVYKGSKSPIHIVCRACGKPFNQTPNTHLDNHGCPSCSKKEGNSKRDTVVMPKRLTEEDFIKSISLPAEVTVKPRTFMGIGQPVTLLCKHHGDFVVKATSRKSYSRACPKCISEATTKRQLGTLEYVISKAEKVHGGVYTYKGCDDYRGNRSLLNIVCSKHGPFKQMIMTHLAGGGCRACGYDKVATLNTYAVSKAETEIANLFKEHTVLVQSDRSTLNGMELDILFPTQKVAIEFNGLYWHSDKVIHPGKHKEKTEKCSALGIDLLHIWEDEWRDKPEIITSVISSRIGRPAHRVYARKTEVGRVCVAAAKLFYETNHIQGFVGAHDHYGLFYKEELVSMASFSKPRSIISKDSLYDLELIRFCSKLGHSVVGGFSKLLNVFKDKSIVTYCDRRLFNAKGYLAVGFRQLHISGPGYQYVKNGKRYSRFQFQKHKLEGRLGKFDPTLTEAENMVANGYSKLYDCGNFVLVKNPK